MNQCESYVAFQHACPDTLTDTGGTFSYWQGSDFCVSKWCDIYILLWYIQKGSFIKSNHVALSLHEVLSMVAAWRFHHYALLRMTS